MASQFLLVVPSTTAAKSEDFSMSKDGEVGGVVHICLTQSWILNSSQPLQELVSYNRKVGEGVQ